jgi:hypothetical protein
MYSWSTFRKGMTVERTLQLDYICMLKQLGPPPEPEPLFVTVLFMVPQVPFVPRAVTYRLCENGQAPRA